jgi:hypothetical protein
MSSEAKLLILLRRQKNPNVPNLLVEWAWKLVGGERLAGNRRSGVSNRCGLVVAPS